MAAKIWEYIIKMFILSVNITDKDIIFGGVMYYITLNNSSHIYYSQ